MSLPKRLIDEGSDADEFERSVLGAELDAAPPAGAETRVLASVLSAVAPTLPMPTLASGAAASAKGGGVAALAKTAVTLGFGKGFVVGIGVSVAAAAGSHLLGGPSAFQRTAPSMSAPGAPLVAGPSPSPVVALPNAAAPPSAAVSAPPSEVAPLDVNEPPAIASPRAVSAPSSASARDAPRTPASPSVASFPADDRALAESRLKEEAALLRRARAELRAGALAVAFATLEASRQKFTAPALSQEREALVIELLYRSGETAAAAARARDFLARFPESPHAAAVRTFIGDAR